MSGNRLAAALKLAELGYAVFPATVNIRPDGEKKVFPVDRWREASTTDPEKITSWYGPGRPWEGRSVCIDCGKSKIVVVDLDSGEAVRRWREDGNASVLVVSTPGGGEHHYYAADPDHPVSIDNSGKLGENADVRGDGGFVFAPGSGDARGEYKIKGHGRQGRAPEFLSALPEIVWQALGVKSTDSVHSRVDLEGGFDPFDSPARAFTVGEARRFCADAMDDLRSAPKGTINARLNTAAMTLGHFVPDFVPEAKAIEWLRTTQTAAWCAATGKADDGDYTAALKTIKSGLAAGRASWSAVLLAPREPESEPSGGAEEGDGLDPAVAKELARLRVVHEARELHSAELHADGWTPPADFGSLANELILPDDEPEYRIKGMLGAGHNAILVSGRKVGKTTTVNELIRSLADEEPFLSRFEITPKAGGIAVFNYEVEQRQYRRWLREMGVENAERVHVLHLRGRSLPIGDARVREWVTGWLAERAIESWIIDPYSRAYLGSVEDGNHETQVSRFLDHLDVIKADAGVNQLIMPVHTPKARAEAGEETAIGSQRLEAWPDAIWYLTRMPWPEAGRFLRAEGRDVDQPEQALEYDPVTRRLVLGGWDRATTIRNADGRLVLDYVIKDPGRTKNEIKNALGWGQGRVDKAISAARHELKIVEGKNRAQFHYPADRPFDLGLTDPDS